jgi:hypothetical protein
VPAAAAGGIATPAVIDEIVETTSCTVCAGPSQGDFVCETCRARIRGEALQRKRGEERAGRT